LGLLYLFFLEFGHILGALGVGKVVRVVLLYGAVWTKAPYCVRGNVWVNTGCWNICCTQQQTERAQKPTNEQNIEVGEEERLIFLIDERTITADGGVSVWRAACTWSAKLRVSSLAFG
jgi:hypothetical protein